MKKLLFILLAFGVVSIAYSQEANWGIEGVKPIGEPQMVKLDNSKYNYLYKHDIYDPILLKAKNTYELLQVGAQWSKFGGYNDYRCDSIRCVNPNISFAEMMQFSQSNRPLREFYFKWYKNNTIVVRDCVFTNNYVYEEPFPQYSWQLSNETINILGHQCQKATTKFRGREWIVWYAEDIPISDGPWKFCGLPGLILKAEDSKGEHKFEVVAIRKANEDFGYSEELHYIKTTREKFNKAKLDYKNEAWKMFSGELALRNADGKPTEISHRKQFFNPEELE